MSAATCAKCGESYPCTVQANRASYRADVVAEHVMSAAKPAGIVHESKAGTYHPDPSTEVAWTVNDTRGYLDTLGICDECSQADDGGLSFAFVCLDGGDILCEGCAAKEGIQIVPCDCETTS